MPDVPPQNPPNAPAPEAGPEEVTGPAPVRSSLDELIRIVLQDTTINTEDKLKLLDELRKLKPPLVVWQSSIDRLPGW
jgi:hypothetical protein